MFYSVYNLFEEVWISNVQDIQKLALRRSCVFQYVLTCFMCFLSLKSVRRNLTCIQVYLGGKFPDTTPQGPLYGSLMRTQPWVNKPPKCSSFCSYMKVCIMDQIHHRQKFGPLSRHNADSTVQKSFSISYVGTTPHYKLAPQQRF